jgi:hypothetical protein
MYFVLEIEGPRNAEVWKGNAAVVDLHGSWHNVLWEAFRRHRLFYIDTRKHCLPFLGEPLTNYLKKNQNTVKVFVIGSNLTCTTLSTPVGPDIDGTGVASSCSLPEDPEGPEKAFDNRLNACAI